MDKNLACGFYRALAQNPDKPAFVLDGLITSYAGLQQQVVNLRLQHPALQDASGERALRIVLCRPNSAEIAAWYLLCVSAGHTLVLTDPAWSEALLQQVLPDLHADLLVTESISLAESAAQAVPVVDSSSPGSDPPDQFLGARAFLIGFTSGSSGRPKAFIRCQQSWMESFANSRTEFELAEETATLAPGPLSHGLSFYAMAESLHNGATFHSQSVFDSEKCKDLLESGGITHLVSVPTILHKLLMSTSLSASSVQRIITAGAKLHSGLRTAAQLQFRNAVVSEYYGASELSFVTVSHAAEQPVDSVGRAFAGVELVILGENGERVATGEVGRIHVRSRMVADGYLQASGEITPLAQHPAMGGWFSVGDMGYVDSQGVLFLSDRDDRMVTSGGYNIFPSAIEKVLLQQDGVIDVAVAGCEDSRWGHVIGALLQIETTASFCKDELLAHGKLHLAVYELPRRLFVIDELPMTSSGKISLTAVSAILQSAMCSDAQADSSGVIAAGDVRVRELL